MAFVFYYDEVAPLFLYTQSAILNKSFGLRFVWLKLTSIVRMLSILEFTKAITINVNECSLIPLIQYGDTPYLSTMFFENYLSGSDKATFIIAEIGQNHQGDVATARKLIKVAKDCGADCVKFQKTCLEEKFNKEALSRPYKSENAWGKTYGEHKKFLEFTEDQFKELQSFCNEIGILFSASAMDLQSLNFLASLNVPFIKIGSGDSNNLILIKEAASKNIPLIISTGMLDFINVKEIYNLVKTFHKNFALLHCISSYPAPLNELNLRVIHTFQREFPDIPIGYSGHELGVKASLAAVASGAKIIERHITLDKNQKGSDHKCSLEPEEFEFLIRSIRDLEVVMGSPIKKFQPSEKSCYDKLGKTIVASKSLKKGSILSLNDLKIKVSEPKGIDGSKIQEVIGKKLRKNVEEDESITESCLL